MVGVLGNCAGYLRVRGRPWQRSRRASEYRKRVRHRSADRAVGDDRLCPDDRGSAPAHGTALGHRWAEAAAHGWLCDLPHLSPAVCGRGRCRHTDRVACADGTRSLDDAGDRNSDATFGIRRERARQGAGPPDKRGGCGRSRRAGDRRLRRRTVRMAGGIPANCNSRGSRHRHRGRWSSAGGGRMAGYQEGNST